MEYSLILKMNVYSGRLLPRKDNHTSTSEYGGIKTALIVRSLIPGLDLLISTFCPKYFPKAFRKNAFGLFIKSFILAYKLLERVVEIKFKINTQVEIIISVKVQRQISASK